MAKLDWSGAIDTLFGRKTLNRTNPLNPEKKDKRPINYPVGRQSIDSSKGINDILTDLNKGLKVVNPAFNRRVIPIIRKLCMINPDLSQALQNVINLGNTGHKISFDRNIEDAQAAKMRNHIMNKHKTWAPGQAGADGMVNRMFSQLMIGGALSNEWVVQNDRKGVETVLMINPEEIAFVLDRKRTIYQPYQIKHDGAGVTEMSNLIKLNPLTYQYYALNGDGEVPYGFPPYMAALRNLCTQDKMNDNIDFIVDQLGVMGFISILVDIPEQLTNETDAQYTERANNYLNQAADSLKGGLKSGTMVGVKDQHEVQFNSIARDFEKVIALYKNNELQIGSAIKQDMTLMGRDYNTSESQITVIFMKMLSELRNIQNIIKTNLEFGYSLELRLAGFNFDYLTVAFDRSTIQDDLKFQQALEYKIKNYKDLYLMGAISSTQFANEMGFEAPDQETPRVTDDILAGAKAAPADDSTGNPRKDQKNKSDRKTRDKAKPQGTKKPQ